MYTVGIWLMITLNGVLTHKTQKGNNIYVKCLYFCS